MKKHDLEREFIQSNMVTESVPQYGAISYHNEPKDPPRYAGGGDVDKFKGVPVKNAKVMKKLKESAPQDQYFDPYQLKEIGGIDTSNPLIRRLIKEEGLSRIGGFADYTKPGAVQINPEPNYLNQPYGTLIHEQQHLIDKARGKTESRYPASLSPYETYSKPDWVSDEDWVRFLASSQKDFTKQLERAFDKYADKYNLSQDFTGEGFFSELKRIGATTKGGIMATDIGKELLGNNPELRETYWQRTRPEGQTYITEPTDSARYDMKKRFDIYKAGGGLLKKAVKKASEALGEHEGKYLNITQSDRMRVGNGDLGGPGFPTLSLENPEYEGVAWGVGNPAVASTMIAANKRFPEGQAIWTTMIGTPEQHRSNQHVFDELHKQFKKAAKAGKLDPVLHQAMNTRLRQAVDKEGVPLFPEDVDILDRKFKDFADRFDKRAVAADVMGGVGLGGKKAQIFDYDKVMQKMTDPIVKDVPSGSLGYRLFTLSGEKSERPDLHSAFPHILHGEDLGVSFDPAPRELIMQKFIEDFQQKTGRLPTYLDWVRGYAPSTQITDEMLTRLQKEGYAEGGGVHMKKGGGLEDEFRKADMIVEPRLIPKAVIEALDTKRKLSPIEAKIAGSYAKPEDQWNLGSILEEIDPVYTLGRGAKALKNVDYGAIKDLALRRYELEPSLKKRREMMQRGGEQLGEVAFSGLDVAPAVGAVASKTGRNLIKNLVNEFEGAPAGLSIKPVGGQWVTKRLEKELEAIAMPDTNAELNKAINGWIRGPLRKYVMNRMGTENDELLRLYDAGIYHKPPQTIHGYPQTLEEEELPAYMEKIRSQYPSGATNAKTPEGFRWEMSSDLALRPRTAREIKDSPMLSEQAPWIDKLAPDEMVYALGSRGYEGDTMRSLGFDHIVDVLKNDIREGKLRPEQLNKVSIEDAAKRTHQYNQEMAKKAEETIAQQDEFLPKHREYPEGYKWVEVKHPTDKEKTEAALKYEGEAMGHCVGSYCEDVIGGDTKIFSLRDSQGKPHVTIEVKESPYSYEKLREDLDRANPFANVKDMPDNVVLSTYVDTFPALGKEALRVGQNPTINQIKGKGNEKPADKYLPFVQDFVKNPPISNEWGKVFDFENTDLIDVRRMKEYGYLPDMDIKASNEVLSELNRIYPMDVSPTGVKLFEGPHGRLIDNFNMLKREAEDLQGPYLTKEDILQHLRSREVRPVEQSYSKYYENPEEPQMAGGGSVKSLIKKLAKEFGESEPALKRGVAYNTYEQVPYAGADHLKGMPEKSYLEKLDFTNQANWDKNEDLLARYLGQESEPSQKGIGLYQPPIEGAPLEMNPQVSTRTKIDTEQQRRWRNEMTPESQANMTALGATRGYFDVQGASPWVRPSEGGKRKYNAFHVVVDGKPTQEEMMKLGEIQNKYGFYGTSDLGKSGVFVGFNFDYGLKDLKKMKSAFEADVKEALGNRVKGVKMVKSEGDYPGYEGKWEAPQGKGEVTRQFMDYLGGAAEQNPLLAEFYAQKPSTELQKLMESMNIRDIEAPAKYGVGAPRKDVLNAREIFAREGVEGLRRALERGEYLPAVGAIGLEGLNDKR